MYLNRQNLNSCTYFFSESILYVILVFLWKTILSHIAGVANRILQLSFHWIFSISVHSGHARSLYAGHSELHLCLKLEVRSWSRCTNSCLSLRAFFVCLAVKKGRTVLQAGCESGFGNPGCQTLLVSKQLKSDMKSDMKSDNPPAGSYTNPYLSVSQSSFYGHF